MGIAADQYGDLVGRPVGAFLARIDAVCRHLARPSTPKDSYQGGPEAATERVETVVNWKCDFVAIRAIRLRQQHTHTVYSHPRNWSSEAFLEAKAELAAPVHHPRRGPIEFHLAISAVQLLHFRPPVDARLFHCPAIRSPDMCHYHQR